MTSSTSTAGTVEWMHKLLVPWLVQGVMEQGYDHLQGPVHRAQDAAALMTPDALVRAYGLDGDGSPFGAAPTVVHVLQFRVHPLMRLQRPADRGLRPWPTFGNGFLRGDSLAPVWLLDLTRVPSGSQLWQVPADGQARVVAQYDGPATGWRGGRGYFPPLHLIGTRAQWRDLDVPADLSADRSRVSLAVTGDQAPHEGFVQARPGVWTRELAVADVTRVFDLTLTCTWRDVPCRIIQHTAQQSRLLLLTDDPDTIATVGGEEVEPGVYEVTAPSSELVDVQGATRDLSR